MTLKFKVAQDNAEKELCFSLRHKIFIEGQNVPPERERDELDSTAVHFFVLNNNEPAGVARLVIENKTGIIGRVGILENLRSLGIGKYIMKNVISYSEDLGLKKLTLGAQEHAIDFYEKLGFQKLGDRYFDANIPHFKMNLIFPQ